MTAAWRVADGAVVRADQPAPAPGVGDVVIEVEAAWLGRPHGGRGDGADPAHPERAPSEARPSRGAVVPGGAAVGRVIEAGDQAGVAVGTRVLVGPHLACGDCEVCRRGGAAVCPRGATLGVDRPGTLAARVVVPSRWVVTLDAALDVPGPAAAAIGGELAIAYALYVRAGIGPREPAVILGDDTVALLLAQVLVAKGVTPVALAVTSAVDLRAATVAVAAEARAAVAAARAGGEGASAATGASIAIAGATSAMAAIASANAARAAEVAAARTAIAAAGFGERPLKIFATTAGARAVAADIAGPRSSIIVAATAGGPIALGSAALAHEVTIHAVVGAHPDLLLELAALVARGEIALADAVTVVPIAELAATLAAPTAGRSLVVTVPAAE